MVEVTTQQIGSTGFIPTLRRCCYQRLQQLNGIVCVISQLHISLFTNHYSLIISLATTLGSVVCCHDEAGIA